MVSLSIGFDQLALGVLARGAKDLLQPPEGGIIEDAVALLGDEDQVSMEQEYAAPITPLWR